MIRAKVAELSGKMCHSLYGRGLYDYQEAVILSEAKKILVLKARQIGLSTSMGLLAISEALLIPNSNIGIMSTDERKGIKLLYEAKKALMVIPGWKTLLGNVESKTEIQFTNGSRILSFTANPDNFRGENLSRAIIDEYTSMTCDHDELFASCLPTLTRGGKLIILSTPKGKDRFHQMWMDEDAGWERYQLPWWSCPDVNEELLAPIRHELEVIPFLFEREYECSFDVFVGSLFSSDELEQVIVPEIDTSKGLNIFAWDPAKKLDKSILMGINTRNGKRTVFYMEELSGEGVPYKEQAKKVLKVMKAYNATRLGLDVSGVGEAVSEHLTSLGKRLVRVTFSNKFKEKMCVSIKSDLGSKKFWMMENRNTSKLVSDLLAFDISNPTFKRGKDGHFDYLAALMCGYHVIKSRSQTVTYADVNPRGYRTLGV